MTSILELTTPIIVPLGAVGLLLLRARFLPRTRPPRRAVAAIRPPAKLTRLPIAGGTLRK